MPEKKERNQDILRLWIEGESQTSLAKKHGISPSSIREVLYRVLIKQYGEIFRNYMNRNSLKQFRKVICKGQYDV